MLFSYFLKGRTFLFILISNLRCVGLKIITSLVTVQEHAVIDKRYLAITTALRISPKFVSSENNSFLNVRKRFYFNEEILEPKWKNPRNRIVPKNPQKWTGSLHVNGALRRTCLEQLADFLITEHFSPVLKLNTEDQR